MSEETTVVETRSPGSLLRAALERKSWTLDELVEGTRLPRTKIQALVHDCFDDLSEPVFVRGYYRKCAQTLGIDVAEVLAAYSQHSGEEQPKPTPARIVDDREPAGKWLPYLIFGLMAGSLMAFLIWWFQQPQETQLAPLPESINTLDTAQIAEADTFDSSGSPSTGSLSATETEAFLNSNAIAGVETGNGSEDTFSAESSATSASVDAPQTEAPTADEADLESSSTANNSASAEDTTAEATPVPTGLELVFKQDCWVRISDATGKRKLTGVIRGGQTRKIEGKAPFKVKLGAADAVEVSFNGRPVDFSDEVRKNIAEFLVE